MCVVSMVMDHTWEKWHEYLPQKKEIKYYPVVMPPQPQIPQSDIDEFYKLLERAREYDRKHNQPDCELEDKKRKLTELAEQLGVKIKFDE